MMQCKRVQEFLQTDYLDGELTCDEAQQVGAHLAGCAQCRDLEVSLRKQQKFLRQAAPQPVPPEVWHTIQEKLFVQAPQENALLSDVWARLKGVWLRPLPVFSVASAFVILLMVAVGMRIMPMRSVTPAEEILASYSAIEDTSTMSDDLGTSIEEYFL